MKIEPYQGELDIDRLIGAFKMKKIDRVPNFEVLLEDKHVEKLLGRYAGNTLALGGDPAKGIEESEGARPMKPEDYIEVCQMIGQDTLVVEAIWTPFKKRKADGSLGLIADRSIKSREDFKAHVILPDDADIDEKMIYIKEYRETLDRSGTKLGFCVLVAAYFQTLYEFMIGLEDCMTLVHSDRDFIEELLDISADYWRKFVGRAVDEGVDFVWAADDLAFKTGLFLPPDLLDELWVTKLRRILEPALNAETPVMFHSDGKIDDLVPMLIDLGIDCIQPMDPYGVDYREYKKRFGGRVCLAGNIDIEFPLAHGTPEDVEKDVKEHMEVMKPGGGYICCSSHSIVNYIPHENFIAMINAVHKYGGYEEKHWTVSVQTEELQEKKAESESYGQKLGELIDSDLLKELYDGIYRGDVKAAVAVLKKALEAGLDAMDAVSKALTPAIKAVGEDFSTGRIFLPELLMASNAMKEALKIVSPLLAQKAEHVSKGKVLVGTIKGDLHDIGKNIVRSLLEGNGFEVVDIGIDNSPEVYVEAIKKHEPDVVGYSGLLTTTLAEIPDQMAALREADLRDRVITIVGGAPVTRDFADRNGIDLYGKDANEAVKVIEKALAGG